MKKRLFIALNISEELKTQIINWTQGQELPIKWVDKEKLHVTLIPPWYEDEDHIPALVDSIKNEVVSFQSFLISLNKVRLVSMNKISSIIWAEGDSSKEVLGLKNSLERLLNQSNIRKYLLHLTLARVKQKDFEIKQPIINWSDQITSLVLFEVIRKPSETSYKELAVMNLG